MRIEDLQGQRLGRYEVTGLLGRGGMAAVYRALDTVLRREIALKVLYPHYLSDQEQIARFQREAVVAASLDHPNIVQMYDVGSEQGLIYIAMQLLPGRTLGDLLRERGTLPPAELAPIVDQVASALDYAHGRGIIHRDIKPANILIDADGRAVLTDFGIAKLLDTPGLTSTSVIVGTPDYMAPEQIGAQAVDGRVDIYALGVLIFRALTGRRPFEGGTDQVLLGHLNGTVPDASAYQPGLPVAVDTVIKRAMARRPADRYQTAGALAADLRAVAGLPPIRDVRRQTSPPVQVPLIDSTAPTVRGSSLAADAATIRQSPTAQASTIQATPVQSAPPRRRALWSLLIVLLLIAAGGGGFALAGALGNNAGGTGTLATALPSAAPQPTAVPATVPPAPTAVPAPAPSDAPLPTTAPTVQPTVQPTVRPTVRPTARPTVVPTAVTPATAVPTVLPPTAVPPTAVPPTAALPTAALTATPVALLGVFKPIYDADSKLRQRLGAPIDGVPEGLGAEQPFEVGFMIWSGSTDDTIYVLFNDTSWNSYPKQRQVGGDKPPVVTPSSGRFVPIRGFGDVWSTHSELQISLGLATAPERNATVAAQRFEKGMMLYNESGFGKGKTVYVLYDDTVKYEQYPAPR